MKPPKVAADIIREAYSGANVRVAQDAARIIREATTAGSIAAALRSTNAHLAAQKAAQTAAQELAGGRALIDAMNTARSFASQRGVAGLALPAQTVTAAQQPSLGIDTPADLGTLVRAARKRMVLTQQAFADLAGVGRRFVSELEAGKPTLEFGKVIQVCRAAGIDLFARPRS